jgi:hypothetical protein
MRLSVLEHGQFVVGQPAFTAARPMMSLTSQR